VQRREADGMKKIKYYVFSSLKRQLVFNIIIGVLCPLLLVMTFLFTQNREQMKRQAVENVEQKVDLITKQVEQILYNIHRVSDYYAYDEAFTLYTKKDYKDQESEKNIDIQRILLMFGKSDPLGNNVRIGAVLTREGELLNFKDPLMEQEGVLAKILDMDVYNKENLSKIIWHPLQDDFLTGEVTGVPRKDKVIIGTRRIINFYSGAVNAVHIFSLSEEEIWSRYADIVSEIYIVDSFGGLISSSNTDAVHAGCLEPEVITMLEDDQNNHQEGSFEIEYQKKLYLVTVRTVSNADWRIIALNPVAAVTESIDTLFLQVIIVSVACTLLCFLIILHISKRFLAPIAILRDSMQEVYDGNMDSYVVMRGDGEIQEMGSYYNSMLRQINQFIENKVETEKKKKQLELEVVMGQVNPHFLYNTLENIVWKSSEAGHPEIGRIAASLGRMYRLSINNGKIVIRIQQEIEHLMTYINIQTVRYQDRVEFDLLVNYEQIREFMTIKLMLQPAVENCFMYALEGIDRVMKIWVRIKVFPNLIRFEIIDNGSGMDKERLATVRKQIRMGMDPEDRKETKREKGFGIGLYSISERIRLYFGMNDAVAIRSRKGKGTVVAIGIPHILSEEVMDGTGSKTKTDYKSKSQTMDNLMEKR